jgi:hypothetical protein
MYGVYMSYWYSAAFLLSCIAVAASLRATPTRYWIAVSAYSLVVVGSAAMAVFPMFFNISMANAFGPHNVSPVAYLLPLATLTFFAIPAVALFPFVQLSKAKWIGMIFFGIALALTAISAIYALLMKSRGSFSPSAAYGQLGLLFLLLWLRVYDVRSALNKA